MYVLRVGTGLTDKALGVGHDDILDLGLELLAESTIPIDLSEEVRLVGLEVLDEVRLPLENLVDGDAVEVTVDTGVDERNHLVDSHGRVLLLLQELGQL